MAVPTQAISTEDESERNSAEQSRQGNCLGNAIIEDFFGLLKSELLYLQKFNSMEHFEAELVEYLDYYNNCRCKAKREGLSPVIYRQQALSAA